jgi:transposase-like protein
MDTKLATTNIRIQQWLAVFKARTESGLTIDEYCDQNGISRNSYYYWLRKAKATALENTQTTFVELKALKTEIAPQVSTPNPVFIPQLTIEKNGHIIGVDSNTTKELLTLVLEAISYA